MLLLENRIGFVRRTHAQGVSCRHMPAHAASVFRNLSCSLADPHPVVAPLQALASILLHVCHQLGPKADQVDS